MLTSPKLPQAEIRRSLLDNKTIAEISSLGWGQSIWCPHQHIWEMPWFLVFLCSVVRETAWNPIYIGKWYSRQHKSGHLYFIQEQTVTLWGDKMSFARMGKTLAFGKWVWRVFGKGLHDSFTYIRKTSEFGGISRGFCTLNHILIDSRSMGVILKTFTTSKWNSERGGLSLN